MSYPLIACLMNPEFAVARLADGQSALVDEYTNDLVRR